MSNGLSSGQTCSGLTLTPVFSSCSYGDLVPPFLFMVAGAAVPITLNLMAQHREPEVGHCGKIYTMEIGKCYKPQLCFLDG